MEPIRIGVIGVGHLGRYHTIKYSTLPAVQLVGVCDKDSRKAAEVAGECQCKVFSEIDDLLNEVDAVSLAVPTDKHFQIAEKILAHRVHCLIEKPITQTCEEADRLIQAAEQNNLILHVGHIERFNPAMQSLHEFELNPRFIESHRLAQFNPRGTEVSVILDLMIHDIDIVLHLTKQTVSSIDATGVSVVSDTVDIANARIHFENGTVANLTASRISQKTMRKMRLFQKDTYMSVDFSEKLTEVYRLNEKINDRDINISEIGPAENKKPVYYHQPDIQKKDALQEEIIAFTEAVRGKPSIGVTGQEGRQALSVALQILNSMES